MMAAEKVIDWYEEALGIITDVKNHVQRIEISDKLISNQNHFCLIFFYHKNNYLIDLKAMAAMYF